MKLEFSRQIFAKVLNIKFHKNPFSGSGVVLCGKTDGRTAMAKLTIAFRNFAKAPKTALLNTNTYTTYVKTEVSTIISI
jgi:hypothetical protein